jgi:hypothetical protein
VNNNTIFYSYNIYHLYLNRIRNSSSTLAGDINSSPFVSLDVIQDLKVMNKDASGSGSGEGSLSTTGKDLKRISGKPQHTSPNVVSGRPVFYPSPSGIFK